MSASSVLKVMKEKEIEYVDLRFTDPRGKLQHVNNNGWVTVVDDRYVGKWCFFRWLFVIGWKAINESDMILKPDLSRTVCRSVHIHNTLNIFRDVLCC